MSKRLGGIIGCKYKTSSWHLNGFPIVVTLGQQHNIGEKPINRHAGTPEKQRKQKHGSNNILFKENYNAPRPSEHPRVGGKCQNVQVES